MMMNYNVIRENWQNQKMPPGMGFTPSRFLQPEPPTQDWQDIQQGDMVQMFSACWGQVVARHS